MTGYHVSAFVDGEQIAADAIAAEQAEDEPRTIATGEYLYLCRECADDHDRAYRAAQEAALAKLGAT